MENKGGIKPKIGLVSITDTPRGLAYFEDRENIIKQKHNSFKKYLDDDEWG